VEQLGLEGLQEPPAAPLAVLEFLAGFITLYVYGDAPTASQRREAREVAGKVAGQLSNWRKEVRG
jgi:hypothetical protein